VYPCSIAIASSTHEIVCTPFVPIAEAAFRYAGMISVGVEVTGQQLNGEAILDGTMKSSIHEDSETQGWGFVKIQGR
jgi:hypothetical protein